MKKLICLSLLIIFSITQCKAAHGVDIRNEPEQQQDGLPPPQQIRIEELIGNNLIISLLTYFIFDYLLRKGHIGQMIKIVIVIREILFFIVINLPMEFFCKIRSYMTVMTFVALVWSILLFIDYYFNSFTYFYVKFFLKIIIVIFATLGELLHEVKSDSEQNTKETSNQPPS